MRLEPRQIEAFKRNGFLAGLPLLSDDACTRFQQRTEAFEQQYPDAAQWAFDIKANLLFDWVYEISVTSALLDAVEDLIGPNILLTNSIFRIKPPGSNTHYGWHQDAARIQVEPPFILAYLAISNASRANGCLRVIPGSHRTVEPFRLISYACNRKVARTIDVDERLAVDLILNKGEVGLFHCNTIHGSGENLSHRPRVALINDYTPADARQSTGTGSGQLVRGVNKGTGFMSEKVPVGAFTLDNILARRRTLMRYPENVLMGPLESGEQPTFADDLPQSG